jgi:long-chain acyl-CoA synthetase
MPNSHEVALYPRLSKKPPFSVDAPGYEPVEGETIPRRNPRAKDKLISRPAEDIHTVYDIVKRSADKFGNAKAIGQRKLIKTHVENKKIKKMVDGVEQEVDKKWTYFELSGYTFMSFVEYEKLVMQLGCGLRKLGMQKEDRLHMFGATR